MTALITVHCHKTISFKQQHYELGVITNPNKFKTVFFERDNRLIRTPCTMAMHCIVMTSHYTSECMRA